MKLQNRHFYLLLAFMLAASAAPALADLKDDIAAGGVIGPKDMPPPKKKPVVKKPTPAKPAPAKPTPAKPAPAKPAPAKPAPAKPAPKVDPPKDPVPKADPAPKKPTPTPDPAPDTGKTPDVEPDTKPASTEERRKTIKDETHYAASKRCAADYASIGAKVAIEVAAYYSPEPTYSLLRKWLIHKPRDASRRFIQKWQGREYPVAAVDDGTSLKANLMARSIFGDLKGKEDEIFSTFTEAQKAKLAKMYPEQTLTDVEAMSFQDYVDELKVLVDEIEKYPANYKKFMDESASLAAQEKALAERIALAKKSGNFHNISMDFPQGTMKPDGTVDMSLTLQTYPTLEAMELALENIRREVKNRRGVFRTTFDYKNKTFPYMLVGRQDSLAIEQAVRIKKMETYLKELQKFTLKQDFKGPVPKEIKALMDRMRGIFADGKQDLLKPEYRLPKWAWNRLHWRQFRSEWRSFFIKDVVEFNTGAESAVESIRNMKAVEAVQNMSDAEKRAIGLNAIAKKSENPGPLAYTYNIVSRLKPVQTLIGGSFVTAGGTGLGYLANSTYEMFTWKNVRKEECAEASDENSFNECLAAYLQEAFPVKGANTAMTGKNHMLGPDGKFLPDVQKEVDDAVARHNAYWAAENAKLDNAASSLNALRESTGKTPSFETFRKNIIENDDEMFRVGILGARLKATDTNYESILAYKWKEGFEQKKPLIKSILDEFDRNPLEYDTNNDSNKKLKALYEAYPGLCDDLTSLLDDRMKFLQMKQDEADQLAEDTAAAEDLPDMDSMEQ